MIKAVIFDMDGLMFDSESLFLDVFPGIMRENGYDPERIDLREMLGCDAGILKKHEKAMPGIYELFQEKFEKRRAQIFRSRFAPGEGNKPGLQELVSFLEEAGIPYAIASSSRREDIEAFLGHAGFKLHPHAILSGKEGFPSKPAPDIFLAAAKRMGTVPEETLVLEDSKYGILAARAGGFPSVWVPDHVAADAEMRQAIQMQAKTLYDVLAYLKKEKFYGR